MSQYLVGVVPGSGGVGTVTSITAGTGITLTPSPITTTGSVALTIPVVIANGGTNATTYGTVDGTIYYNGTRLVTTVTGTAGQVLTSNGVGVAPTYQAAGGGGITTIDGDSGSVTGSTVTITGGTSGAVFTGAGSTLTESFNFISLPTTTSTNGQILINSVPVLHTFDQGIWVGDAGNFTIGGTSTLNLGIGKLALSSLTTFSQFNCAIGNNSLGALTSHATNNIALGYGSSLNLLHGTGCIAIGVSSGTAWTGSESYNIAIANTGTVSTSNQLNIGSGTGSGANQLNSAFISGIQTIVVVGTSVLVSATDQLGVAASSAQFKSDIQDMADSSSPLLNLRPVTFVWNKESSPGLKDATDARQFGLIAEEVDKIMPSLVNYKDGLPFSVNYHDLPAMLLNEVKKLSARVESLKAQLKGK